MNIKPKPAEIKLIVDNSNDAYVPLGSTEHQLARAFVYTYRNSIKYLADRGKYAYYDNGKWELDITGVVIHSIAEFLYQSKLEDRYQRASTIRGMEYIIRHHIDIGSHAGLFDTDPFLLGTPDGVVDLKSGELRNATPEHMITKSTFVGPKKGTPGGWLKFFSQTFKGSQTQEYIDYMQLVSGYCLTGSVEDHCLWFLYGLGGNGKGVYLGVMSDILSSYCVGAPIGMFELKKDHPHNQEIASFQGARLVIGQETTKGQTWDDTKIKALTGGDLITAHFMHKNNFTFKPNFKIMIAGNHEPRIKTVDDAIKRRLVKLPFDNKPPPGMVNKKLQEELVRGEGPQILNWMIEGCVKWGQLTRSLSDSAVVPQIITRANLEYQQRQGGFKTWLQEKCDLGIDNYVVQNDIALSYALWAADNDKSPMSDRDLKEALEHNGCIYLTKVPSGIDPKRNRGYKGIKLKSDKSDEAKGESTNG